MKNSSQNFGHYSFAPEFSEEILDELWDKIMVNPMEKVPDS